MTYNILKRTLLAAGILILCAAFYIYPKLSIISGYAAKNMASSVHIAKRSAPSVCDNDHNVLLINLADTKLDREGDAVSASVFGLMERRAICRNGLGCTLVNNGPRPAQKHPRPHRTIKVPDLPFPYGNNDQRDSIFANVDYELLQKALDGAFARPEIQKTRTVLVVYKNHIIAERYSQGMNRATPILGWSMTKSVFATFFGILEYQKKIDVATFRPFMVHGSPGMDKKDPRTLITLNHLLRMQSGLAWDEDYTSISDVNKMLFLEDDMSRPQAEKEIVAAPGEIWNYSSGTTNYLSGILRKELGSYQEYLNFPYVALIDKIGMSSMLLEVDMAGNFVGSS
ncbi:MAG TPA: serine hydrolase, partial [Eudoraea sp.]|nr:serine hydrolase [Eudoraea sp.]